MNPFDDIIIDDNSFAYKCMIARERWDTFTPVFGALTVIGATSYFGRIRSVGRKIEGQVKFSAATSIASIAGTDYLTLPIAAVGYAGIGVMTNDTTNIAVGLCHFDVAASRLYLPTQAASANTFNLWFEYET